METDSASDVRLEKILSWVGAVACGLFVLWMVPQFANHAWDFRAYYFAGMAHSRGLDPYLPENLALMDRGYYVPPFLYPPYLLPLLSLVAKLPFDTALALFLFAKGASLWFLLCIWRRVFLPHLAMPAFVAVAILGCYSTIFTDIISGNISIFEQTALWFGLAGFVEGKPWRLAVGVALASAFKLVLLPLIFLGLLDKKVAPLRLVLASYGALLIGSTVGCRELTHSWLAMATTRVNEMAHPALQTATASINALTELGKVDFGRTLWAALVIVVCVVLFLALKNTDSKTPEGRREIALLATLTLCLVMPRMMIYSLILALPSCAYFLSTLPIPRMSALVLLLFPYMGDRGKTMGYPSVPVIDAVATVLHTYWAMWTCLASFSFYTWHLLVRIRSEATEDEVSATEAEAVACTA